MDVIVGSFPVRDGTPLFTKRWAIADPQATMVLVHGASEHIGRWNHVAEFFVDRGFEVFGYDHRGHGASGGDRIHVDHFDDYVEDLAEIVAHVRSELPLVIYGHSMGGLIATAYAESAHQQPELYVLSAPALDVNSPGALKAAAPFIGRALPKLRLKGPVTADKLSRDPKVGEAYMADPMVHLDGTTRWGAEFLAAGVRCRTDVGSIRVPVLVIHGGEDTLIPPAASAPLAAGDTVERRVFPGLRHEVHNEPEAKEVLEFVAGWLEGRLNPR